MQINRLFEIVYILLNRKSVTARELSERLGVSRRTICRDIEALSMAGIPIYTERGKGGGVSLLPDFVLNKSLLSESEQNEILSSLYCLSSIKPDDTNQVLRKLSTLFGKAASNWMEVDFSGWSHENNYFNDFKTAILERRIIAFDYYKYNGKTVRRVEPVQILFRGRSWYLRGFCLTRQDMRVFKVSRIRGLTVTDTGFSARGLLAPPSALHEKGDDGPPLVNMKFRIGAEMTYRVLDDFYESMVEEQPDGSFIVTVSWPENNWLYGFILSFGSYIEVIEPEHIRAIIKEEALNISNIYL